MKNENTRALAGGGVGGAAAVLVVWGLSKAGVSMTGEEGGIVTLAFSTIFGYLARFLPKPKDGGAA